MDILKKITPQQKGGIYIIIGILILLDAMNLLSTTIHYVILIAALTMIIYGIILTDLARTLLGKKKD